MAIRPWDEHIWFSPCHIISTLAQTIQTGNPQKIKRHKEAWVCAVAVISHSQYEPAEWWIQIPKQDPPDVKAMHIAPRIDGPGNSLHLYQMEVFEISEHDDEPIEESIKRKLGHKDYSDMMLVGFVRRKQVFDHVF